MEPSASTSSTTTEASTKEATTRGFPLGSSATCTAQEGREGGVVALSSSSSSPYVEITNPTPSPALAIKERTSPPTSMDEKYDNVLSLSWHEIVMLRKLLQQQQQQQQSTPFLANNKQTELPMNTQERLLDEKQQHHSDYHYLSSSSSPSPIPSLNSEYSAFPDSTHAWAVFCDDPNKRATPMDRCVGCLIIFFQLFTYWLFAAEAIQDYQQGQVPITIGHAECLAQNEHPNGGGYNDNGNNDDASDFRCQAEFTNDLDAFCAFFMLGIFLTGDFIQAGKVWAQAPTWTTLVFASLAGMEVVAAFVAACIAVSYNLYIGQVTDAVEVGVGLLFIRELSQRAYSGIRDGKVKQYRLFFSVLAVLIGIGMLSDPLCEHLFAA